MGLMIAVYDRDNAAWQALLQDAHPLAASDALRFMLHTTPPAPGKRVTGKKLRVTSRKCG